MNKQEQAKAGAVALKKPHLVGDVVLVGDDYKPMKVIFSGQFWTVVYPLEKEPMSGWYEETAESLHFIPYGTRLRLVLV